jgi:hypothetical protein
MGRRAWLVAGSCLLFAAAGCAETQLRAGYAGSQPLPAQIAAYYDYPPAASEPSIELTRERATFREYFVKFPLAASGFEPTEPMVEVVWFESKRPGRRAAIVFNPILGGDYPLERGICRFLAAHGFHTAMVRRKTLKISPEHEVARIELLLRQGVVRIRQVVDWMQTRPEVDPDRLGCYGISMGGIACVMASAVEPRFKATVAALAGGTITEILTTSTDSLLTKPRRRYLERNHMDVATLKRLMEESIKSDPIRLAPYVDATRMFMFIAAFDRTIGRRHSLNLWRALGRPRVVFLPAGHYTSYLLLPYLKFASLRYFQETLGTEAK